jgi:hypothetical protein
VSKSTRSALRKIFRLSKRLSCEVAIAGGVETVEWRPQFPPDRLTSAELVAYRRARVDMQKRATVSRDAR